MHKIIIFFQRKKIWAPPVNLGRGRVTLNTGIFLLEYFTYNTATAQILYIDHDKQLFMRKIVSFLLSISLTLVLGAQKEGLIEMVLLSTQNICVDGEIRKSIFNYALHRFRY